MSPEENASQAGDLSKAAIVEELRADVVEMRRLAFGIEDALQKTPRGISIERAQAIFIKNALFDHADHLELH